MGRLVIRYGLDALPQAARVSAVFEVAGYFFGVVLFCSSDATGQAGSRCSQANSIPGSEGFVSGPQQPMDSSCQPWLLVSPSDDGLCVVIKPCFS